MRKNIKIIIAVVVLLISAGVIWKDSQETIEIETDFIVVENTVSLDFAGKKVLIDLPPEMNLESGEEIGQFNLIVDRPDLPSISFVQLRLSTPVGGYKWRSYYGDCNEVDFAFEDGKLVNNKDCADDTKIVGHSPTVGNVYEVHDGDAGWLYTGFVAPLMKKDIVVEIGSSIIPEYANELTYDWKQSEAADSWLIDILKTVR